jgi:tol-pal system beta propeller repeat protein TolB
MRHRSAKALAVAFTLYAAVSAAPGHARAAGGISPPSDEFFYQDVAWSPDGEWIAFSEFAGGEAARARWSIYVARRDGGERRLLIAAAKWATWSPDGRQLAFQSTRQGKGEIYLVDADGRNIIRITDDPADDTAPAWSPEGDRIAFSSDRGGNTDIYVMSTNGSNVRRLTEDPANDYNPAWSSDGEQVVFYRDKGDNRDQIWVREVDGPTEWDVTDDDASNIFPCFLADGSIAFSSARGEGERRLVVVDPDGKNHRRLGPAGPFFARWSPDGGTVAFIAGHWPKAAIYVMRFDGVGVEKIVN